MSLCNIRWALGIGQGLYTLYVSGKEIANIYNNWDGDAPKQEKIEKIVEGSIAVAKIALALTAIKYVLSGREHVPSSSSEKNQSLDNAVAQTSMEGYNVEQSNTIVEETFNIELDPCSTTVVTEQVVSSILNSNINKG